MNQETRIFKSHEEFLNRPNKQINGVSRKFAKQHPNYKEMNSTNISCYNCDNCSNCKDCNNCSNSTACISCEYSINSTECISCYAVSECTNCTNCRECNKCSHTENESCCCSYHIVGNNCNICPSFKDCYGSPTSMTSIALGRTQIVPKEKSYYEMYSFLQNDIAPIGDIDNIVFFGQDPADKFCNSFDCKNLNILDSMDFFKESYRFSVLSVEQLKALYKIYFSSELKTYSHIIKVFEKLREGFYCFDRYNENCWTSDMSRKEEIASNFSTLFIINEENKLLLREE